MPGIEECILESELSDEQAKDVFLTETAGISEHPAELMVQQHEISTGLPEISDTPPPVHIFMEKTGVSDTMGDTISGRTLVASGLRKLVSKDIRAQPGLIIKRGQTAVNEYNNPALFPGMYPTLFPYGLGGIGEPGREEKMSFNVHTNYFFDLADRVFRYHHSFMFVVFNILQRRMAHLQTHLTCKKSHFDKVAAKLTSVLAQSLINLANKLENEGLVSELGQEEKNIFALLSQVNAISTRVPGSEASKKFARNEIMSYIGYIGISHIFLTINPSPQHSPIFQVMYGDTTIDLTERFPNLVLGPERAQRLAHDPVAATDFFEFSLRCIFEYLFGWDY